MKKIFTLAAAVLASFSLWAETVTLPSTVLTLPEDGVSDSWSTLQADHFYYVDAENNYAIYLPYALRNSGGSQTWFALTGSGSSANAIWNALDGSIFKGFSYYQIKDSEGKARYDRIKRSTAGVFNFRVTNCTKAVAYVKLGKKGDVITAKAYEVENDVVAATAAKEATYTDASNATAGTIELADLDGTKEYVITVFQATGGSDGHFYEIAFYYRGVKSTAETLKSVTIDGSAISAADLATLKENETLAIATEYLNAPKVVFTKTVTTTYIDDAVAANDEEVKVTATEKDGKWQAQDTINEVEYTITMAKAASYTVTYMNGETKLGEELVAPNGAPANYATYETQQLATFNSWHGKADLSDAGITMASAVITKDTVFYANFTYTYAQSINIEQIVLDKGTKHDVIAQMGGIGYSSNIENSLDSLNDLENKTNRNYAFLGLKVKAAGKMLDFRVAQGKTVKVKFGNIGKTPLVSINGADYADMVITDGIYTYTATGEDLISIKTADGSTVIFQQIMIDEDLKEVELPAPGAYLVTIAETTNGTVTANWENKKYRTPVGATVILTVTPTTGYAIASVKYNDGEDHTIVADGESAYKFTMPAAAVTVSATFVKDTPDALDNTDAAAKAVKRVVNGQLIIEKNGKVYNVMGQPIR